MSALDVDLFPKGDFLTGRVLYTHPHTYTQKHTLTCVPPTQTQTHTCTYQITQKHTHICTPSRTHTLSHDYFQL
jgi:hypothetical protein